MERDEYNAYMRAYTKRYRFEKRHTIKEFERAHDELDRLNDNIKYVIQSGQTTALYKASASKHIQRMRELYDYFESIDALYDISFVTSDDIEMYAKIFGVEVTI